MCIILVMSKDLFTICWWLVFVWLLPVHSQSANRVNLTQCCLCLCMCRSGQVNTIHLRGRKYLQHNSSMYPIYMKNSNLMCHVSPVHVEPINVTMFGGLIQFIKLICVSLLLIDSLNTPYNKCLIYAKYSCYMYVYTSNICESLIFANFANGLNSQQ